MNPRPALVRCCRTPPDLTAYYRCDDGTGNIVTDSTGSQPITLSGTPTCAIFGALLATSDQ